MNRFASRIASGALAALLVIGGAGIAQAGDAAPRTSAAGQVVSPDTAALVGPLTNDWG
ncbi:hypothetical protein ACFYVL_44065 [Streptomyces sp. NPDC004111]|uniref:hypothetical protein n=1 Tax=Streptomyces sp. NPDC004111 TaxID=3364690 RepID=UPI0036ABE428